MSTEEILTKILERLSAPPPAVPLSIDLWDIASIAAFLKRDPQVVRERMACLPDFPKAIRLPTKTGRAQPLYKAAEVIAWTNRHQERN
jgi:hypothetical protein